jgi:hypothetical protein
VIDAPDAPASEYQIEEDEAEKDRCVALVDDREEALRCVPMK